MIPVAAESTSIERDFIPISLQEIKHSFLPPEVHFSPHLPIEDTFCASVTKNIFYLP